MLTTRNTKEPGWVAPFLAAMRAGTPARAAAQASGTSFANASLRRRRYPEFARQWAESEIVSDIAEAPRRVAKVTAGSRRGAGKLDRFLDELAASSNVAAAAATAGISVSAIYRLRRSEPEFARRWYAALAEGYDNLEMELLGRLRSGDHGVDGAKKERGKFDTATALRCLAAHRESVAREKGRRTLAEEAATIESINAKIDKLRLAGEASDRAIAAARRENARRQRAMGRGAGPATGPAISGGAGGPPAPD